MPSFKDRYHFFGFELACKVVPVNSTIKVEKDAYPVIKKLFPRWRFERVETVGQQGFPDIALFNGPRYLLTETKLLKKKQLVSLEDDLTWQFGQLPFAQRSFAAGMSYCVTVAKDNNIAFIGDSICLDNCLSHQR